MPEGPVLHVAVAQSPSEFRFRRREDETNTCLGEMATELVTSTLASDQPFAAVEFDRAVVRELPNWPTVISSQFPSGARRYSRITLQNGVARDTIGHSTQINSP